MSSAVVGKCQRITTEMVSTNENDSLSRQRVCSSSLACVLLVSSSRHHDDDVSDSMFAVTVMASTVVDAIRVPEVGAPACHGVSDCHGQHS